MLDNKILTSFIIESNLIENETSLIATYDSIDAYRYLEQYDILDKNIILETHRLMMENIDKEVAGKFRNYKVWVSKRECPDCCAISSLIDAWLYNYNDFNKVNTSSKIKKSHIEFEKIHPFGDGNGRIGRLIYLWHFAKNDLKVPIITFAKRSQYYLWFKEDEMIESIKAFNAIHNF